MFLTLFGYIVLMLLAFQSRLLSDDRKSIEPFLSGDTFRAHADYIYDETNEKINFREVAFGSTIFVKTDFLSNFFEKVHPHLIYPYVLITHNSDRMIPGSYQSMLDDEKILAWFGQNVEGCVHPKLHPIPIGLGNFCWPHGKVGLLMNVREDFRKSPKQHFLYMNFNKKTNINLRSDVYNYFVREPYCFVSGQKGMKEYFSDIANSLFVLSPRGNGLDCHRTWEALYLGAFPVVISSSLDPLFSDLPVVIVKDWKDVTFSFLEEKVEEFKKRYFSYEQLWTDHWYKQIDAYKILPITHEEKQQFRGAHMKKGVKNFILSLLCVLNCHLSDVEANEQQRLELEKTYLAYCSESSDINEHLPVLREIASQCASAVEIGIRSMVSTWGIIIGLSENVSGKGSYIGIDLDLPPWDTLQKARVLAESQNVSFQFWKGNDMQIDIPQSDMLFIDSLHTYCHLTYELEKFSPKVNKFIALHDTSDPWGTRDDDQYHGDYSEYDSSFNKEKRGLWPAVVDFLERHPEWCLHERRLNSHGLTVLKRIEEETNR